MTDDPARIRARTAAHEVGHLLGFYLLRGQVPEVLSIRKGAGHDGVCLARLHIPFDGHDPNEPPHRYDPWIRSDVESAIMTLLAGREAEDLGSPFTGYRPDPDADAYALLPADGRLALDAAEAEPASDDDDPLALRNDEAHALELARRLVGHECAAAFRAWLRVRTRVWVLGLSGLAVPVIAELVRVSVMPGADAVAIVNQAIATESR